MYGASLFPNMFLDLTGTVVIATRLQPRGAEHTTIVTDYLFRPEVIDDPAFDPSEVVDFAELVARQDYDVCERVQLGVSARARSRTACTRRRTSCPTSSTQRYLAARERA